MEKLKIEKLKNDLFIGELGDRLIDYNSGYIGDVIAEIADNNVPIYTDDIWKEAAENASYIEEALDEYGTPTDFHGKVDILCILTQGLCYKNECDLYNNLEDNLKFWAYNYIEYTLKIKEITEEQNDNLLNWDFSDNSEQLENLIEHINNIFEEEKEEE